MKTVLGAVVVAWRMVARMLALYKRTLKRATSPYFAKWWYEAAKQAMRKQADQMYKNLTVCRCCYHLFTAALLLLLALTCSS